MRTSEKGIEFLERHEGVVLKAYRDPTGTWTIGAGLTAASGVVKPRAGMAITREEARALMAKALERNYEPAVAKAMPGAKQHEFDGGSSFHWNTGAIGRASWVGACLVGDWPGVQARLMRWTKSKGRVLPGLERRRREEYELIRHGKYAGSVEWGGTANRAKVVVPMTDEEVEAARLGLKKLGYKPGFTRGAITKSAVITFQRDHDLTVDGIIGRATLSTLQRRLDARAKTAKAAAVTAGGVTETQADVLTDALANMPGAEWIGIAVVALGALWLARLAFSYRDAVAAKTQRTAPKLAAQLRRF
ncbi:MAG: glycoside hydrolase family protein [Paracoccaceae bacterium]